MDHLISRLLHAMGRAPRLALLMLVGLLAFSSVVSASAQASPVRLSAQAFPNATLIRDSRNVTYLIWDNIRHPLSGPAIETLAYATPIVIVTDAQVAIIPLGNALNVNLVSGGLVNPRVSIDDAPIGIVVAPSVVPGASLSIGAIGFTPHEAVTISGPSIAVNVTADANGRINYALPILSSVNVGLHHVYLQGQSATHFGVQVFHVVAPVATSVTVSPTTAAPASTINVTATGFANGERVEFILQDGQSTAVATANASSVAGPAQLLIPGSFAPGNYAVLAYGTASGRSAGTSVVVGRAATPTAQATVSPSKVAAGSPVLVSGSGFDNGETVVIRFTGSVVASVIASPQGLVTNTGFTVPVNQPAGSYSVSLTGATSGRTASAPLTVQAVQPVPAASITLNPSTASVGSQAVIGGSGFQPGESVLIRVNGNLLQGVVTDASGNFTGVLLPIATGTNPGVYTVSLTGATSGRTASAPLTVQAVQPAPTASIAVSPTNAVAGARVYVSGTGYVPGETLLVSFNNVLVQTTTASASGSFVSTSFVVPSNTSANVYPIAVTGATSGRTANAVLRISSVPATPVTRAFVTPASINRGQVVRIGGTGFGAGEIVLIRIDGALVAAPRADSAGSFVTSYRVLQGYGAHTIAEQGASTNRIASVTLGVFHPIAAGVGLEPNRAHRGSTVRVNGNNFQPGETVLVRFRGVLVQAALANSHGSFFGATFIVPGNTPFGFSSVTLTGATTGRTGISYLYISRSKPAGTHIGLSARTAHHNSLEYVSGSGYFGGETIVIRFNGAVVQAAVANRGGSFSRAAFRIPVNVHFGLYKVSAVGGRSGRTATSTVRITPVSGPGISVAPHSIVRHGIVTVSGHGFFGGEIVLLSARGRIVEAPVTDRHGQFRITFRLPTFIRNGVVVVQASGGRSHRQAQVTLIVTKH